MQAALDIGVTTFTMAAVAAKLGVTSPALYRCFWSREELLEACLQKISGELTIPPDEGSWRTFLERVAHGAWSLFTVYPEVETVFSGNSDSHLIASSSRKRLLAVLGGYGFTGRQALFCLMYITNLTTSSVAEMHRRLAEFTRDLGSSSARSFRTSDDTLITDAEGLIEAHHQQWQMSIDFFLDHLAALEPDWPEHAGPVAEEPH